MGEGGGTGHYYVMPIPWSPQNAAFIINFMLTAICVLVVTAACTGLSMLIAVCSKAAGH